MHDVTRAPGGTGTWRTGTSGGLHRWRTARGWRAHRGWRVLRWRVRGVAAVAGVSAVALATAACGGSGSASGTTITVYNGQHEQTTAALVAAFEKQTGIGVKVRNGDESVLVNQIETEGSASPADVIYTENSLGARAAPGEAPAGPGGAVHPGGGPATVQLAERELGRGVGPGQRHDLQHRRARSRRAAEVGPGPRRPGVEGQDRPGRGRGRLLPHRGLRHPCSGTVGSGGMARRGEGERRGQRVPGQRDVGERSQRRARGPRDHQPLLLVPPAGRGGNVGAALGHRHLRARRSGLRHRRLGRRRAGLQPRSRPRPSGSWPFWSADRARRSSPTARASSTPSGRA